MNILQKSYQDWAYSEDMADANADLEFANVIDSLCRGKVYGRVQDCQLCLAPLHVVQTACSVKCLPGAQGQTLPWLSERLQATG